MDNEIVKSPAAQPPAPRPAQSRMQLSAKAARIAGGLLMAASFFALIGFAVYPLLSGQGVREFFVSLPVPFLISLMGLVPGALLYFTGRHVLRSGPGPGAGIIAAVLSLPPLVFGLWLLPELGATSVSARLLCLAAGLVLLIWAIALIRARRKDG